MKGNLLFVNGCYPKEYEELLTKPSKVMPQNAANVLSWRLIEGLEENIPGRFQVLTCPFIGYYPNQFSKAWISDGDWSHNGKDTDRMLGFPNIKGLETLVKSERIYAYVKRWYRADKNNRNLLFYSHYAGFLRAVGKIRKRMPDLHITVLVTDMNEWDERKDLAGFKGKIKGFPRKLMIDTTYRNLPYVSSFVVLAEQMQEYLKVGDRPYVVVEGIAKAEEEARIETENPKSEQEFRVVYTGTLHERYGVLNLAEAFRRITDTAMQLYICGSGDGEQRLKEMAEQSSNIHYLGVLPHKDAIALQGTADLLVNSMPEFGIHTALSFPSKTMEYMLKGKPVLCFKVRGIPDEYDGQLLYFPENTPEAMAEKLLEVRQYPKETLKELGESNRRFVKEKKNPGVMVKKILDMME